jgi:hypothetical protein
MTGPEVPRPEVVGQFLPEFSRSDKLSLGICVGGLTGFVGELLRTRGFDPNPIILCVSGIAVVQAYPTLLKFLD